jgi:hypothetical protein
MAMRRPTIRLKSADLPTFGRPTMAIKPGMLRNIRQFLVWSVGS